MWNMLDETKKCVCYYETSWCLTRENKKGWDKHFIPTEPGIRWWDYSRVLKSPLCLRGVSVCQPVQSTNKQRSSAPGPSELHLRFPQRHQASWQAFINRGQPPPALYGNYSGPIRSVGISCQTNSNFTRLILPCAFVVCRVVTLI